MHQWFLIMSLIIVIIINKHSVVVEKMSLHIRVTVYLVNVRSIHCTSLLVFCHQFSMYVRE